MFDLEAYNFELPEEALATEPAKPRDSAKLMVYNTATDKVLFDTFANLDKYLPAESALVFNNTKVLPARVILHKQVDTEGRNGGKVEILFLVNEWKAEDQEIKGLSDRKIIVGQKLYFDTEHYVEVTKQEEKIFYFKPQVSRAEFTQLLERYGTMPLPKYLKQTKLQEVELKDEYQTIFALAHQSDNRGGQGSVAAPTAALHFTPELIKRLRAAGIGDHYISLHVGLGTFAPISEETFRAGKLHTEYYEISHAGSTALKDLKEHKRKLISVGTTTTRALESSLGEPGFGSTNIFIYPPYEFRVIDGLITNFHLPKSSLLLMVDAFLQHKGAKRGIIELYKLALDNHCRFYSFGDGMLII